MEQTLTGLLYVSAGLFSALLMAGVLSTIAVRLCRRAPIDGLKRLNRTTLAVLAVMSAVATIEAQKRGGGDDASLRDAVTQSDVGRAPLSVEDVEPPPFRNVPTNTLHFVDIAVGTNAVSLTLAWPPELFAAGTMIDLFVSTSLVEAVWSWQCAHAVAIGETNWTALLQHFIKT